MEEILASIRRIIADEADPAAGTAKAAAAVPAAKAQPAPAPAARPQAPSPVAKPAQPEPKPAAPAAPPGGNKQDDIDALFSSPGKPADEPEVLDLTEPVDGFKQIDTEDIVFREEASMSAAPAPKLQPAAMASAALPPAPRPMAPAIPEDLMSSQTTAAVNAAFGSLATTILSSRGRTLEDLVQELMRPMLKEWLDENLPGLVERMVRAEIERVSRGGR